MNNLITIQKATVEDIDIIIESIIESSRNNTDRISYCKIFNISLIELKNILRLILLEDIPGHEFCLSNFLVAKISGRNVGACCSWIEAIDDLPSSLIKFNLLYHHLKEENIEYSKTISPLIKGIQITRDKLCLQIESVFVSENFRGLGISTKLINEHFRLNKIIHPATNKSQLIVAKGNESALNVYKKLGFVNTREFNFDDSEALSILPANCFVLMEKVF